jgi:hypothetical protein
MKEDGELTLTHSDTPILLSSSIHPQRRFSSIQEELFVESTVTEEIEIDTYHNMKLLLFSFVGLLIFLSALEIIKAVFHLHSSKD